MKHRAYRTLLCLVLVGSLLLSMTVGALAGSTTIGTDASRPEYFKALGASGNYNPLKTPYHYDKTTGNVAYCLEYKKDSPSSSAEYTDFDASALWGQNTVTGIQAIVDHGYPNSNGGLSEEQAHYATANAIRAWMKESADVGYEFMRVDGQQRAVGVVAVVDGVRAVRLVRDPAVDVGVRRGHAVYSFRGAFAVRVVGECQRAAGFGHAHQLAALCPGIRPLAVREQVADLIVLEAAAVVAGQQVSPAAAVSVAIGYRIQRRAETARCIGIFALAEYVSCRVIRPRPGLSGGLIVFTGQLTQVVVDIGRRTAVCRDRRDVPTGVICVRRCLVKLRALVAHRGQLTQNHMLIFFLFSRFFLALTRTSLAYFTPFVFINFFNKQSDALGLQDNASKTKGSGFFLYSSSIFS